MITNWYTIGDPEQAILWTCSWCGKTRLPSEKELEDMHQGFIRDPDIDPE